MDCKKFSIIVAIIQIVFQLYILLLVILLKLNEN